MLDPKFISIDIVLGIHHTQVNVFGGLHGLRDQGLLESAIGQAKHTFTYTHDIYEAAAQYCYSLAQNPPFLDGNKRTAAASMLTFLVLNKIEPTLTNEKLFEWTLEVAIGELSREKLADLLRRNTAPINL